MKECLGDLFGRKKSQQPGAETVVEVFNPYSDLDRARREAFVRVPGAVRGSLTVEVTDGIEVIDFDNRDEQGLPTKKFYLGTDISDSQVE